MMNPHEKRLADQAYEARLRKEEQERENRNAEWMAERNNPTLRLLRKVDELNRRIEMLELEQARLRLLERQRDHG